jgi:hypothetical protein
MKATRVFALFFVWFALWFGLVACTFLKLMGL